MRLRTKLLRTFLWGSAILIPSYFAHDYIVEDNKRLKEEWQNRVALENQVYRLIEQSDGEPGISFNDQASFASRLGISHRLVEGQNYFSLSNYTNEQLESVVKSSTPDN